MPCVGCEDTEWVGMASGDEPLNVRGGAWEVTTWMKVSEAVGCRAWADAGGSHSLRVCPHVPGFLMRKSLAILEFPGRVRIVQVFQSVSGCGSDVMLLFLGSQKSLEVSITGSWIPGAAAASPVLTPPSYV